MEEYIKTTISRTKLYERDYNRDSIEKIILEKIILEKSRDFNNSSIYKVLIDILTQKYLDNKSV
ncbi:TPA: hypothetical protein I9094_003091 [Clostridium perfringens]|nr:hypothetical protein [Clostridium perfringens]HAT4345364.1 hypothetical protein [Clostridium perfringens]